MKKYIYLDIDGVLCLGSEIHPKLTKWGYTHRFNTKAVKVLNEILEKTDAEIIISSDWKDHYSLTDLQEIFEWQKVIKVPIGLTESLKYKTMQLLEEFRAKEILTHAEESKPEKWVAVDDLDLSYWITPAHFTICTRWYEGIKQSGVKEKIIAKLS